MTIHVDYMDYILVKENDKHLITDINIKDKTKPHIHFFVKLVKHNPELETMIRICSRMKGMNRYVSALEYGLMEITDPSNGYTDQRSVEL